MNNITKKILIITLLTTMLLAPAMTILQASATTTEVQPPNWDVTGYWCFENDSHDYPTDIPYPKEMDIIQDENGDITGEGRNLGDSIHTWDVAGYVTGDSIVFTLTYDTIDDYVATFTGPINTIGEMEGTWTDNTGDYESWESTCGNAVSTHISLTLDGSPLPASIQILTEDDLIGCIPPLPLGIAGEFTPYIDVTILEIFDGTVTVKVYYEDKWLEDEVFEESLRLYMGDCVDFNLDGTINGQDLAIILKAIKSGTPDLVPFDVDNNGVVNEVDVDIVKEYMTKGLIVNQDVDGEQQARLPWLDITFEVHAAENYLIGTTDHFSIFRGR